MCQVVLTKSNLNSINILFITGFRETLSDYVVSTQNSWMSRIRDFLSYAYKEGFTTDNLSYLVVKRKYQPSVKLPSLYTEDEINAILNCVDRSSPCGKRDYAILMLAAKLGIRSGDISCLKFENFIWNKNLISFTQQKTGTVQTLPLLNDVGEAIISYLQEGRPISDEKYIFLNANAPYSRLTANSMHPIMKKYANLAKIKNDPPRKW